MTELEKACESSFYTERKDGFCKLSFKEGFNEALKPQHMKLTPEVQALIEVVNKAKHYTIDVSLFYKLVQALKPFEKEE